MPGDVVRAFNTTRMLDRIAAKHDGLIECGIGFKYICDLIERQILVGGEDQAASASRSSS